MINVYAPSENAHKTTFFDNLLKELEVNIPDISLHNIILLGDMNIAKDPIDIISGNPHKVFIRQSFSNFLSDACLTDVYRTLHPESKNFTWSSGRTASVNSSARRLDYIFVSESLAPFIKTCSINNFGFSDHRAVTMTLEFAEFKLGKGLYKLNSCLLKDENYKNLIITEIKETEMAYKDLNPHLLWDIIKTNVRELSKQYSNNLSRDKKLAACRLDKKLTNLQSQLIASPNDEKVLSDIALTKTKLELSEIDKARGAQIRARVKDIEEGETNTSFFLGLEKSQGNSNIIKRLTLSSGVASTKEIEILDEISTNFAKRYNNSSGDYHTISKKMDNYIKNLTLPRLSVEDRDRCDASLSEEEVAIAAKLLNRDSAP